MVEKRRSLIIQVVIVFVLLPQPVMHRTMLPFELTMESAVFPLRHGILVGSLVLRFELVMGVLMLCIQVLMRALMLAFIRVVRQHDRRKSQQASKRNREEDLPHITFHLSLLS